MCNYKTLNRLQGTQPPQMLGQPLQYHMFKPQDQIFMQTYLHLFSDHSKSLFDTTHQLSFVHNWEYKRQVRIEKPCNYSNWLDVGVMTYLHCTV